jgi:cytochrome o ubiquinol oxidase subunit 1
MIIAIPTGVKIFNWLFTIFRGKVHYDSPMYWLVGFLLTFTAGGMTGVLLAIPGADFQLHNSLFLVAHFHNTIIGGVVFGYFAGLTYWFPKAMGFSLDESLGKKAFWCWIIGFFTTFVPLYILGAMGMTRRLSHIDADTGWQPLLLVAFAGVLILSLGVVFQLWQIVRSIRHRTRYKDKTGDPWNGRTLEWSTSSPPPEYNFAVIPTVHGRDAFWNMKYETHERALKPTYQDIHVPKNTPMGLYFALAFGAMGFALVWHIAWLALLGFAIAIGIIIVRSFDEETERVIGKKEVEMIEKNNARA